MLGPIVVLLKLGELTVTSRTVGCLLSKVASELLDFPKLGDPYIWGYSNQFTIRRTSHRGLSKTEKEDVVCIY